MTYDEIKSRLTQVETALQTLQNTKSPALDNSYTSTTVEQLNTIRQSLQEQLAEAEETMFVSTKGGDTKAVQMDRKTAMDLKKDPAITGIDTAKGAKIKEQEGINFSVDETKGIAKLVGKGLLKALKQAGDEVSRIKAHRIEENSFDIHVTYKGESREDEFSFYIDEDVLHLVDFSFDKELVDVGVKPSGEAIVHVDHLANELLKHFKSLNEQVELEEGPHQTAYIKIPLKDAKKGLAILDRELGGDFMDIVDNDGDGNLIVYIVNTNDNLATAYDAVMDLQAHDIEVADHNAELYENVTQKHIDDIEASGNIDIAYKKAMELLKSMLTKADHSAELDENVTQKHIDDIEASGNIDIAYKKAMELLKSMLTKNEALDHNDPVLMRARVAKMRADDLKKLDAYKKSPEGRAAARAQASAERKEKQARALVQKLKIKRAQIEREMESDPDIEPEGGPVADMYGDQLNKIDNAIEKAASVYNRSMDYDTAIGKGDWGPETNPYMDKDEIERRAASLKSEISDYARRRQRESDYYVSKKDAPPKKYREPKNDYFARRKAEDDYVQENISQEVVNKVSRFITSLANHYDYSEQDAVYAIMQALRAHKGNFDGLNEIKAAKIQKAYSLVVAKMKELAKQYKAGDKSVVPQLKDLTAKKRSLEKQLDNAVAGTHRSQELTELSTDQRNDLVELQNILDDAASLGEQAREVIRQSFPNMLSKADAYGVFNFGSSANRYDTTLESIIEEIEEYYDEEEDLDEIGMFHDPIGYKKSEPNPLVYTKKFVRATDRPGIYIYDIFKNGELVKTLEGGEGDANAYVNKRNKEVWAQEKSEGKYKSDAQRKAIHAKKAELKEMDGGSLFDYFANKGYDVTKRRPDGYPPKEGVEGYQVTRGSDRSPQSVIFQYNPSTDHFTISQMSGYRIDQKEAIKAGMRQAGRSWVAGQDSYMTDGNYNPVDISAKGLKDIVDHVMTGLDREAKAQGDFYKARGNTSGTIDELKAKIASAVKEVVDSRKKKKFKVGDKVTYLGHPGEITKVNKEMTGAITYNVSYDKGTGRTKATNIWNKDGEIKPVNEEEKSFTDYNNKELAAYCKNNPTDKKAAAELHKRAQNLKNLTRTDEAKDNIKVGDKATCCGKCGRVHVKVTKCKTPYLKGKSHCRNK